MTLYSVYNRIKDGLFYFIRAYYYLVDGYTPMLKKLSDLITEPCSKYYDGLVIGLGM